MALKWTDHPILKPPSTEQVLSLTKNPDGSDNEEGLRKLYELWEAHEQAIRASIDDPLRFGLELESWKRVRWGLENYHETMCLGGNRSSKTTCMARLVMEATTTLKDGHVVMFSQNEDTSIKVQQASMWEYMPFEFKKKTKGIEGYINYSMQNGFTAKSFIFPDTRTRVDFKTYAQFSNNQTILEGFEFGFPGESDNPLNIGAALDEYLGDSRLVDTLRFRLATRNSRMLIGFTPIDGFTPFISDYLKGAETIETRHAALLGEPVPVKQYSPNRDAAVVYLHTDENPFGGYERVAKDLRGRPRDEILVRAYGVPVKSMTHLFPLFSTTVNVLPDDKFPDISDRKRFTVYQVVDPAGNRNYTSIWAGVDRDGDVYIRREWPDRETYGEWAIFGDPKWKKGPATHKVGHGVQGYVDEFREIEDDLGLKVFERIGDSRYFASENDDNVDLFTQFSDKGMDFVPADGREEKIGLTALDEWFNYNPNAEVDGANKPRCYIHASCGNLIESLLSYDPDKGKAHEPLKDWIDLMRYLRLCNGGEGPEHYDENSFRNTRKTWGY